MNFAHLHLLLNHFPVIGAMLGFALFALSFFKGNGDLRRASLIVFAAIALLSIPTFLTGFGAQFMIQRAPSVSTALIERHESSALLSIWFILVTGALSLVGLWQSHRSGRVANWNVIAILLFSLFTVGLMVRTGNTGGEIRHPEVWANPAAPTTEGALGSIVHAFEPNPQKFTDAIVSSKWWWAFMMDLHFLGLALIIGTVGILDLRIMGFAKQLAIGPLHKLIPWGMFGLALNIVTGLLAFIGQSENYIDSLVFWLKMLALLLLGANVAAFYLTGIFDKIEPLGPGESAPLSAKLIAVSSLVLWFAVIALGRYIQLYSDTLPHITFQ
jgi:uncharacterized membrane protein